MLRKFALVLLALVTYGDLSPSSEEILVAPKRHEEYGRQSLELYTPHLLEIAERSFTKMDLYHGKTTVAKLDHQNLVTYLHSKPYVTALTHWYEDEDSSELEEWAGPEVDQELCLRQLEQLNGRLNRMNEEKSNTKDTNLLQLLDTYEWYSSGVFLGGCEWPGNYNECLRLKINSTDGLLATRYCSGAFKSIRWPKTGKLNQIIARRAGVCLPKACDSARYKNKYQLIEQLVSFNGRRVDEGEINLDYLYCLPDSQSPKRLWYNSPSAVAFVGFVIVWISILVFATLKCNEKNKNTFHLYRLLSVIENVKSLLNTTPTEREGAKEEQKVNFDVVEGIKVLATCYVVSSHALLCFSLIMNNGREMATVSLSNASFLLFLIAPSMTVNVFFSITGILTAYLLFKTTKPTRFVRSPLQWVIFVALRYIRIMPLYALVVAYEKYLAKYTGSGPLWDYGTSVLGQRRACEEEPWSWVLLYAANFKAPLDHCVPPAWYLANDLQFALITPIFLILLQKWPRFGRLLTMALMLMGYLLTLVSIATTNHDLQPMARFMPHGFHTYVYHLSDIYTRPQYRLPVYLCGLLLGHALYLYEQRRTREMSKGTKLVGWPKWMKKYAFRWSLLAAFSSLGLPYLGDFLQCNQLQSRILIGFMVPTYNLLVGLAAGLYILLAATGQGNSSIKNFLASPRWKPLSRLNLCVLLINMEVINYFAQTSTHMLYFDFKVSIGLYLFSLVMSYSVALVVCVLFESPLRNLINNYLKDPLTKGDNRKNE